MARRTRAKNTKLAIPAPAAEGLASALSASQHPATGWQKLEEDLRGYLDGECVERVAAAFRYSQQAHSGQQRRSGDPYVSHPLAVAGILAWMRMDEACLSAALLHDVLEDTLIAKSTLEERFGVTVAELVDGVSKLERIHYSSREEAQVENASKMMLAMARDVRVILIKLADRLHNMYTLASLSLEKRRRVAQETLDVFAPIAHRLGMGLLAQELEECAFAVLRPLRARLLRAAAEYARYREAQQKVQRTLEVRLGQENIPARVEVRRPEYYSLYRCMREEQRPFDKLFCPTLSVVSDTVDNCYRVLGNVHSLYHPVAGRFQDQIAIPRHNGHQELRTVLFLPHAQEVFQVEVRILTEEMALMQQHGIVAYWNYQAPGLEHPDHHFRTQEWLEHLLDIQSQAGSSLEFVEHVKHDLFPEEVYVFTPEGQVLALPRGATPIDFAYKVHTSVGDRCLRCLVDNKPAPLSQPLENGQVVRIISSPQAQPDAAWLDWSVSARAHGCIRQHLRRSRSADALTLGRRLLKEALAALGSSLETVSEEQWQLLVKDTGSASLEEVLRSIGAGDQRAFATARHLLHGAAPQEAGAEALLAMVVYSARETGVSLAPCCRPVPGDPIIGHISTLRGIALHHEACHNIAHCRQDLEKCQPMRWAQEVEGTFPSALRVDVENRRGVIAELAAEITRLGAPIEKLRIEDQDGRYGTLHLVVSVSGREHLGRIQRKLGAQPSVIQVMRVDAAHPAGKSSR